MGIPFFQAPFPADVQKLILSRLSSAELLQKCMASSKELGLQAIFVLLSRTEQEAREYQKRFLEACKHNPHYAAWFSKYPEQVESIKKALRNLTKQATVSVDIRYLAFEQLESLSALGLAHNTTLDQEITQRELENILGILKAKEHDKFFSAFSDLIKLSSNLSPETSLAAIPLVTQHWGVYTLETQEQAWKAFIALFARLPEEEKMPWLEKAFKHPSDVMRRRAYRDAVLFLATLRIELAMYVISEQFSTGHKDCDTASKNKAWTKFLTLFSAMPEVEQIRQLKTLLRHSNQKIPEQTCLSITFLVEKFSATSVIDTIPLLLDLLGHSYTDVQKAASTGISLIFAKLIEQDCVQDLRPLFTHQDYRVRLQSYRCLIAQGQDLDEEDAESILTVITPHLFDDGYLDNVSLAWQAFTVVFPKLSENQQMYHLGIIAPRLNAANRHAGCQGYENLAKTVDGVATATLTPLLTLVRSQLDNTNQFPDIRAAACKAQWRILARLPEEMFRPTWPTAWPLLHDAQEDVRQQAYRGISLTAHRLHTADMVNLLPELLTGLTLAKMSSDACLILKSCMPKLGPLERENVRAYLTELLLSESQSTRQIALELASFPGVLELWTPANFPKSEHLELLYLQKMLGIEQKIRLEEAPIQTTTPNL